MGVLKMIRVDKVTEEPSDCCAAFNPRENARPRRAGLLNFDELRLVCQLRCRHPQRLE
jgi:hypothetical protein